MWDSHLRGCPGGKGLAVIYFPLSGSEVSSPLFSELEQPGRGQRQGREQSSAQLTQSSQPGAAVNRISSKVTSSGSHRSHQRKLRSFFSPFFKRRAPMCNFSCVSLLCEEAA